MYNWVRGGLITVSTGCRVRLWVCPFRLTECEWLESMGSEMKVRDVESTWKENLHNRDRTLTDRLVRYDEQTETDRYAERAV